MGCVTPAIVTNQLQLSGPCLTPLTKSNQIQILNCICLHQTMLFLTIIASLRTRRYCLLDLYSASTQAVSAGCLPLNIFYPKSQVMQSIFILLGLQRAMNVDFLILISDIPFYYIRYSILLYQIFHFIISDIPFYNIILKFKPWISLLQNLFT